MIKVDGWIREFAIISFVQLVTGSFHYGKRFQERF